MKLLKQHICEALKIGNKNLSDWFTYTYQPKTKKELKQIIINRIYKEGPNCDLNDIDVSLIEDMSWLFFDIEFNGNISMWDVSNVNNMIRMFSRSNFNGDISNWNIHNVESMNDMFVDSKFNQDISNWNINKNCDTFAMFHECFIKEEYKPKALQK